MRRKKTILITCSRLVDLAGAEVTTLELAEAFINMGWDVSVAAFELGGNVQPILKNMSLRYFDLTKDHAFEERIDFDLVWLHHNVTAYRVLLDERISVHRSIFSSLSFFEPIESPPLTTLYISHYVVNSTENLDFFVTNYPALKAKVSVFCNSSPSKFWGGGKVPPPAFIDRLAIVSNHIPKEVYQLIPLLAKNNITVDIFGLDGKCELVTPERLSQYDAVMTIGKTVQYCIACMIPVYCYDHFGGNGWLTPASFDQERKYNFSGRGGRGKVDVHTLFVELQQGFSAALENTRALQELGKHFFILEDNIAAVLAKVTLPSAITTLSQTNRQILHRQNKIYLNLRNTIANLNQLLVERNKEIFGLQQTLSERDVQVSDLNQLLVERNKEIFGLQQTLSERDVQMSDLNQLLVERNKEIFGLQQTLSERDVQVSDLNQILVERNKEIFGLQQTLSERDVQVSDLNQLLVERNKEIFGLQQTLSERDVQVSDLNQILVERNKEIFGLQQTLSERDVQVSDLNQLLVERNKEIFGLQQTLSERDVQVSDLNQLLVERNMHIADLVDEHSKVLRSYSWRLTVPFRKVARSIVRARDNIKIRLSWFKFLLLRSKVVIEHQGFLVFMRRAVRYTRALIQRKKVILSSQKKPIVNVAAEDDIIVSFVIPVYDRTNLLRIAIQSALNQTVSNIEIILVTDGSPAETVKVVNEFADNPKVRIFNYPRSSGNAVRGRNKGIKEARGRYIAFLDSDDVASPDRLERCLPLLESGEADVVYGSWQAIVDGSRDIPGIVDEQVVHSPDADLNMLVDACVPCQSTVIVRKSLFDISGLLKLTMKYREDHELWARLAFFGGIFKSTPHVLVQLRLHSGNNELNFKDADECWRGMVEVEYKQTGPKPKKIAFILPGVGISGGIAVVFKHAELLMEVGHDAFVINVGEFGDGSWFTNNPVPIIHVSDPRAYLFRGIDLLIATGWSTVEWLKNFDSKRYLYFVQSDERRFFDDDVLKKKIHDTYLTPCEYFTEALWIKRMLLDEFGHDAAYVPNGLDPLRFFPDVPLAPKTPGKLRVLLEGPIVIPFKGMADSYAAVEGLDCEIWIVSSAGKPPQHWKYDRFFEAVPFDEMRQIYSSCDIFLKMSRVEGFFGPPMEAMACGCAVVVGKVTGYDEYILNGINALVVEEGDIVGARNSVEKLIFDDSLRSQLINEGKKTVLNWGWNRSLNSMLNIVENKK